MSFRGGLRSFERVQPITVGTASQQEPEVLGLIAPAASKHIKMGTALQIMSSFTETVETLFKICLEFCFPVGSTSR